MNRSARANGRTSWSNVLPQVGGDEMIEVSNVRRCNNHRSIAKRSGLSSENHIRVQTGIARTRVTLLARLGPEFRSLSHRSSRNRQVSTRLAELVELRNALNHAAA